MVGTVFKISVKVQFMNIHSNLYKPGSLTSNISSHATTQKLLT